MALNKLMHPRNPYKKKRPDFMALAAKYPKFRERMVTDLKGKASLDFKNPDSLRALSWALLKDDFDLDVDMPSDRLIPTIPLRLNYILWLEDLLQGSENAVVHGIDIGCGASCVYALIGAKKNQWRFLVSEADPMNYEYAVRNVTKNKMDNRIKVQAVTADSGLSELIEMQDTRVESTTSILTATSTSTSDTTTVTATSTSVLANATTAGATAATSNSTPTDATTLGETSATATSTTSTSGTPGTTSATSDSTTTAPSTPTPTRYSFCMCNPPFFGSNLEAWGLETTRNEDRASPMSCNSGSDVECITEGGEVDYVARIIRDSLELRDRVRIYTTMLGKKSSVGVLKECLRQNGIHNFGSTEFCQGRTMRWALGWSFDPTVCFPKPPSKSLQQQKPKPPMTMVLPKDVLDVTAGWTRLLQLLHALQINYTMEADSVVRKRAKISAQRNTWTHQRRQRRQKRQQQQGEPQQHQQQQGEPQQQEQQHGEPPQKQQRLHQQKPEEKLSENGGNATDGHAPNRTSGEGATDTGAQGNRTINGNELQSDRHEMEKMEGDMGVDGRNHEKNLQSDQHPDSDTKIVEKKELEEKDSNENNQEKRDIKRKAENHTIEPKPGPESNIYDESSQMEVEMGRDSHTHTKQPLPEKSPVVPSGDSLKNPGKKSENPPKASDILIGESVEQTDVNLQEGDVMKKNAQDKECIVPVGGQGDIMTDKKEDVVTFKKEDIVSQPSILEAEAVMKKSDAYIMLELQLVAGGKGDRETLHQVLQYIKNSW